MAGKPFTPERRIEKFWAKVREGDSCWLWIGALGEKGYGHFWTGQRFTMAHRFAYEISVGPIPDGLEVDHLCRTRACVNPAHLEAVSHAENIRRGERTATVRRRPQPVATHCGRDHLFDEANTYVSPDGGRHCRTCRRERMRAYLPRWRAEAA